MIDLLHMHTLLLSTCNTFFMCKRKICQSTIVKMSLVSAILLLASISSISKTAAGQCDYVYIAEPPSPQLICNPHVINQLRLVCSIFVADVSRPDTLTIQWFFGAPNANRQFDIANLLLFQQVDFTVVPREIFTSRIVVSQFKML